MTFVLGLRVGYYEGENLSVNLQRDMCNKARLHTSNIMGNVSWFD